MGTKCFVLFMAILGVLVFSMGISFAQESVPRISKEELKAKLGSPDLVVIDVRGEGAGGGKDRIITGAVREDPSSPEKWAVKYSRKTTLVIYCA